MTVNPNDYDPSELRRSIEEEERRYLSSQRINGPLGGTNPIGADDVLESSQYRELYLLEGTASDGGIQRPYLTEIPASYAAEIVVFEWIQFLIDRAGFKRSMDVLRYYRAIEWITEDVESQLRDYLSSFDETDGEELRRTDHLMSLVYVAKLAAMK